MRVLFMRDVSCLSRKTLCVCVCVQTWLRTLSKAARMLDSLIDFTLYDFGEFFDQGAKLQTAFKKGNGERFEEFSMFLTTFS